MKNQLTTLYFLLAVAVQAQTKIDLKKTSQFTVVNRTMETVAGNGQPALRLSAAEGDGLAILKDVTFSNGTIEFDVKGRNVPQQSFVGIAFFVEDRSHYDAIYFRPFNFMNADTARRRRAVQYISMPDHPWEKLREQSPGRYEAKVSPTPDAEDWFHARIVVDGKKVSVYVNKAASPSLSVERLSTAKEGSVALWVGNNSDGSFSNLVITPSKAR